jgi:hypothetical protein
VEEAVAALTPAEREEADLFAYVPDRYLTLVARHVGIVGARARTGCEGRGERRPNGARTASDGTNGHANGQRTAHARDERRRLPAFAPSATEIPAGARTRRPGS